MEKEIEALRKAGRDRERDLDTLNTVLQCNQDIINVRTHTLETGNGISCIVVLNTHTHTHILRTLCTLSTLSHAQVTLHALGSFILIELLFVFAPGPASGSGGEGATAQGGGEREGDVETEGPCPRHRPAGEGGSDPGAGELSERWEGNIQGCHFCWGWRGNKS